MKIKHTNIGPQALVQETSTNKPRIIFRRKGGRWLSASGPHLMRFTMEDACEVARSRSTSVRTVATTGKSQSPAPHTFNPEAKPAARVHGAASVTDILGGPRHAPGAPRSNVHFDRVPRKFHRYLKLLLELREHVGSELELHTRDTLGHSSKEDTGDLSGYGQHMADAGTESFDRDFALNLVSSEQEALGEIESAIKRIYDGTYGACEVTGQPIEKERLLAVPFTRFSFKGQMEHERHSRRPAGREGAFIDSTYETGSILTDNSE